MKKLMRPILLAVFAVLLCASFQSHADPADKGQELMVSGRRVSYWPPPTNTAGKLPLILFSHGFKGCGTQTTFLTAAIAADGYWVFAPDHDDASCHHGDAAHNTLSEPGFGQPQNWSDATYDDRADDMRNLLDALQHNPDFKNRIDFSRIGLVGHSLGGYTVLGLAGAWPSWKLPNVKAVLALSPYGQPFGTQQTLGKLKVPVMYQGGTRDPGITPWLMKDGGGYDQTPAPKYFVEYSGATHFAWTDLSRSYRDSINAYSLAFLDHYVKGLPATAVLTANRDDVSEFRYDSDVGSGDLKAPSPRIGSRLRQRLQGNQDQ